jgi:Zn-dependent protease
VTLPLPTGEGTRGLRFRALGFPVRIDVTFLIVIGLLGLSGGATPARLVIWVAVAAVSILAHELGHAVLARSAGTSPIIDLYAFGGVTRFAPSSPLSRLRMLSISVAGPLVGIVVGVLLLVFVPSEVRSEPTLRGYAVSAAVFVNLGWGALNLLPILPLDGGNVLVELLPGDPDTRRRRAAAVSVVAAGLVAVFALTRGFVYGGVLAAWFAFDNVRMLRPAPARPPAPPGTGDSDSDRTALWLVDEGRYAEARHLVETLPHAKRPHAAVHGLVLALTGTPRTGRKLAESAVAEAPDDPTAAGALARLLVHERDWAGLFRWFPGDRLALVPPHVLVAAQQATYDAGAFVESARIGDTVGPAAGEAAPLLLYNAACAWARAGHDDRALDALGRAVDLGWRDVPTADADADLVGVRNLPGWPAVRTRMAGAAQP